MYVQYTAQHRVHIESELRSDTLARRGKWKRKKGGVVQQRGGGPAHNGPLSRLPDSGESYQIPLFFVPPRLHHRERGRILAFARFESSTTSAESSAIVMAAHILAPIAQLNNVLLTQQVHATLFPYPLLSTLHAARIALVHQALSRRARDAARQRLGQDVAPTWAYDMAGFLIMVRRGDALAWGGFRTQRCKETKLSNWRRFSPLPASAGAAASSRRCCLAPSRRNCCRSIPFSTT